MDHSSKIKVLKQLARTPGEIAETALENEAAKIAAALERETRFDCLEQQIELLDNIAYRVPKTALNIIRRFIERLDSIELTHHPELDWPKGELEKYENKNHLLVSILKLINGIRYHEFIDVLELSIRFYNSDDEEVSRQARKNLKRLSEYNINIFYNGKNRAGLGPGPQLKLLEWLESRDTATRQLHFEAIIELCTELLSPSMEGREWDYKSVTFSTAATPAIPQIINIRERGIRMLKDLYRLATTTPQKISVLNAMLTATQAPRRSKYGDDVLEMVTRNAIEVLAFFKKILPDENLQIVQKIEQYAYWEYRRAVADETKSAALQIRDLVAEIDEYAIYRDLIGFEGIFHRWEDSDDAEMGYSEREAQRSAKVKDYAKSINAENWSEWRDRIIRFCTTESDDLATFPYFFEFLREFAERSPDLAFGLLTENLDDIESFIIPLLRGLWKGPRKPDLRALMMEWIAGDRQLVAVTKLFLQNDDIDEELLQNLLSKSVQDAKSDILNLIVAIATANYGVGRNDLVPRFFLPAVKALTDLGDARWVDEIWFRKEARQMLEGLDDAGREVVLSALFVRKDINYHAEDLLVPLAKKDPKRIILFFRERVEYEAKAKPDERYDAIPFEFHNLQTVLAEFPDVAVDTVRSWFKGNDSMFQFRGANLLKIIFPGFAGPLEAKLIELVRTRDRTNIEFVLLVLKNYEGEPFLLPICREIVIALSKGDKLRSHVVSVLYSTGMVSGEFGIAEAFERKVEEIKPWLKDKNEKVRDFAADYIADLKKQAKAERKRAKEQIEVRKHVYGVREELDDN